MKAPAEPRQLLLFSGHMIDTPGRPVPRFPAHNEAAAGRRIADALDALDAGAGDLALSQAAAGGDLLFLEACLDRGVRCQVMLPLDEAEFIERSILPSADGERWRDRWLALKARLADAPLVMGDAIGVDAFERCNEWLLRTAESHGMERVRLLCLWDGAEGDGPGGTRHMIDEVKRRNGRVIWIDTRTLG